MSQPQNGTLARSLLLALLAVAIAFPITYVASAPIISTACEQILDDPQVDSVGEVIGAGAACLVVGGLIVAAVFLLAAAALIFLFGLLGWVTYGIRTFLWTLLFGLLTLAGLVVLLSLTG